MLDFHEFSRVASGIFKARGMAQDIERGPGTREKAFLSDMVCGKRRALEGLEEKGPWGLLEANDACIKEPSLSESPRLRVGPCCHAWAMLFPWAQASRVSCS